MHTIEAQNATQRYKFGTKPYEHQYTVWNESKDKKEYAHRRPAEGTRMG